MRGQREEHHHHGKGEQRRHHRPVRVAVGAAARLEDRGLLRRYLCPDDRRGIYTEVTPAGCELLAKARPDHDRVLADALDAAAEVPELADLAGRLDAPLAR
nr:hypothetical protein [Nakamurella aerolata]